MPTDRLLGIQKVMDLLDCSRKTVDRLVKRGDLPAPVWQLGERRWFARDLEDYIERLRHDPEKRKPPPKSEEPTGKSAPRGGETSRA